LKQWFKGLAKAPPRLRTKKGAKRQNHRQIDTDDIEAIRARKVSANRILGQLKGALNYAVSEERVAGDRTPWRNVKPHKGVAAARVRYLSVDEAQRLINGAEPEFRPMIEAGLLTGARYAELCRLRVEDFNPDSGTILIRRSKSAKARHVVLTDDEGVRFFTRQSVGRRGSEPMLGIWGPSHQVRRMKAASERAEIDPLVSFHGLRHTWASHTVMAGVPLMVVAKNLGHSDTRMVEKHYGHLAPSYVTDEIRRGAPRFGIEADNVRTMS
jgi:integrase